MTGDFTEAAELAQDAEQRLREVGNDMFRRTVGAIAAEALAHLGRREEAQVYVEDAIEADKSDVITHVIAHRAAARLALGAGRTDDADRDATLALRLLEGAEAPLDRAETLIRCAETRLATGSTDEAQALLAEARGLMAAKGASAVVRRIDQVAATSGIRLPR